MTKRARLTTEAVLDAIALSDEDFEIDDVDEPCMEGSDEEFSDLEDSEDDMDSTDCTQSGSPCTPDSPTPVVPSLALPQAWSRTLKPVTITPFCSPVGPTVPISTKPSEVFELFFPRDLMQVIVEESNK